MFRSIELANFKAFGERTLIELAPITLIFGQNSAGKSSILQALSLLKQTRESREAGAPLLPRAEGGITDLGSFQEMLFDHELARTLSIGLQIEPRRNRPFRHMLGRMFGKSGPESVGISLRFQRPEPEDEVHVAGFDVNLRQLDESFASFTPRSLTKRERRYVDSYYWHPSRGRQRSQQRKLMAADCKRLSAGEPLWKEIYAVWFEHREVVTKALKTLRKDYPSASPPFLSEGDSEDSQSRAEQDAWQRSINNAVEFYANTFTFPEFVDRMTSEARSAVVALDGFVPVPLHRGISGAPELFVLGQRRAGETRNLPSLDIARIAPMVGHMVDDALESLFPMGPFRRPPERWYIFTGTSPEDVGYRGDLLPDLLFRRSDLILKANEWLERLDIGYALRVRPIGESVSDLFEMRLVDLRRATNVDVALSDVGFGISQILPFLVQTLASNRQVISIEQPEVHLHPKLQADLGDLLAMAIGDPYEHQFLIETHSEHLVLRLQKLVREGQLSPADVSVIFVSRGHRGSEARRLRLDDDGRFMDEWPGGFFAERLRELA